MRRHTESESGRVRGQVGRFCLPGGVARGSNPRIPVSVAVFAARCAFSEAAAPDRPSLGRYRSARAAACDVTRSPSAHAHAPTLSRAPHRHATQK